MNINNFLNKENINTLWDVVSDEEIFKFLSRDIQPKISNLFSNNIKGFFETERTKTNSLIDLNKKYILLILNHIKKNYPYQPNKIKIYDELPVKEHIIVKEHITSEEIQNERKTQFEKDLQQRQQEFENIINIKVPPVPEFADKCEEIPISEMDKIIKEMTAKRKYDVEQINRNYSADVNQTNNWLMSQETSLKTEKLSPQKNKEEEEQHKYSRFNFLNLEEVDQNNIISPTKKNVTWGDNEEFDEVEENIFNKLKKVTKTEASSDNIFLSLEEKPNEDRITNLESQIKTINNKMDLILDLLKQNK
jgi:hypothetical protein